MEDDVEEIEIPDVDEEELMKIFENLQQMIEQSIKQDPVKGGKTLASMHYRLFQDLIEKKNEKARLALLYLQAQLGRMISAVEKEQEVGQLMYAYTRRWLHFVLLVEAQMASFLSYYTFRPELPIDIIPLVTQIEEKIPLNEDPNIPGLPESIVQEFQAFADAANDDAGEELKNWLNGLLRQALIYDDPSALETLNQFQISFPSLMQVGPLNVAFNTLFHQYGESWFQEIYMRKKWLNRLIQGLNLYEEEQLDRMLTGYYWSKLDGIPLKVMLEQRAAG